MFREIFQPWADAEGEEYDLLRMLPPVVARGVYQRAWRASYPHLLRTWWGLAFLVLFPCLLAVSSLLVWRAAAGLGWGGGFRVLFELVFHLFLARFVLPPITRRLNIFLRPFVWDELVALAESEMAPQDAGDQGDEVSSRSTGSHRKRFKIGNSPVVVGSACSGDE